MARLVEVSTGRSKGIYFNKFGRSRKTQIMKTITENELQIQCTSCNKRLEDEAIYTDDGQYCTECHACKGCLDCN